MTQIAAIWADGVFRPAEKHADRAGKAFKVGTQYILTIDELGSFRSMYFACCQRAFENLPEDKVKFFLDADHLRKHALLKTNHCTKHHFIAKSHAEALRHRAYVKSKSLCIAQVVKTDDGSIVEEIYPISQKADEITPTRFRKSAEDVLAYLASLLGVSVQELTEMRRKPTR